jgi:hypothetical protein
MSASFPSLPALALALAVAQGAAARDAPAKAAPAPQAPVPARVRASHRVDVIGPGERVETIIDRMRASQAAPPPAEGKAAERLPVRAPQRAREVERAPAEVPRGAPARGAKVASPPAVDRSRK